MSNIMRFSPRTDRKVRGGREAGHTGVVVANGATVGSCPHSHATPGLAADCAKRAASRLNRGATLPGWVME